jgi:hypothetical protein
MLLEVLLQTRGAVVADQLRIDAGGDDLGAVRPGGAPADPPPEDDRDFLGATEVEVIPDAALEEAARPDAGRSNARVSETSIWRNARS